MHNTGQRGGGKKLCPLARALFSPPVIWGSPLRFSQHVSKAEPRNRLTKNHFLKEGLLDFKDKTENLSQV